MLDIHAKRILIIDFGSQYTQIIARRIREIGVYCEIYPFTVSIDEIQQYNPAGIILSGGPESVTQPQSPRVSEAIFNLNIPILGICYGMQLMAVILGGEVLPGKKREFGYAKLSLFPSILFENIEDELINGVPQLDVWMSHGDKVTHTPDGFKIIASSNNCEIAAMEHTDKKFFGLQFHPEVSHTPQGVRILKRFLFEFCGSEASWTADHIIEEQVTKIKETVGSHGVILGLSGGVDSSVAALLLHKAIQDQLTCVFVDTGLLRLNEAQEVKSLFEKHFGIKLVMVDAKNKFLDALQGVSEPEQKRKIIGRTFIEIFDEEAAKLDNIQFLAQGTIYSDVIESAASKTGKAHVIKSHHNVGGLPETLALKLIEPLRELFKDEVRKIGLVLGLPANLINRHPFPGPGLGVRILGEVKAAYLKNLQLADAILIEELHKADWYDKVSQAFAVFLPVKSVGVVGDARQYEYVLAIRIVETVDFMTAKWSRLPYELLETISSRIINEVPGISRVTYDISSKPPATIEWE